MSAVALPAPRAPLLQRRFGGAPVDAVLRATGIVALLAIPIVLWVPQAAPLVPLALTTLWMRGPLSGFIPVGLEPVLMIYGRIYPAWVVTLVAAAASAYAEVISLSLLRGVVALPMLARIHGAVGGSRAMRLFQRRPALAIALTAVSPIPDWVTRSLASVSRYSIVRYVAADTIGRLPKLFIPALLGSVLHVPDRLLLAIALGSVVAGAAMGFRQWWLSRRVRSAHSR